VWLKQTIALQIMDSMVGLIANATDAVEAESVRRTTFVSSLFYSRLADFQGQGYSFDRTVVQRWVDRLQLDLRADRVFVLVNEGRYHWVLVQVEGLRTGQPSMDVFDSMRTAPASTKIEQVLNGSRKLLI
jgi:Ulp1 family protease